MPERARKTKQRAETKLHPAIGRDGRTIAARLVEAMALRKKTEADLLKRCNEIAGERPNGKPFLTQQAVNDIIMGKTKASRLVPILAEALDVRAVWLQWGIGDRTDDRIALPELIESLKSARRS